VRGTRRVDPPIVRFWAKVDKSAGEDACWLWTARTSDGGYGRFNAISTQGIQAHRYAWEQVNGPIPKGLLVCHTCDNPPCCNPAHLFLGTNTDNARDRDRKGRSAPPPTVRWIPRWAHEWQEQRYAKLADAAGEMAEALMRRAGPCRFCTGNTNVRCKEKRMGDRCDRCHGDAALAKWEAAK